MSSTQSRVRKKRFTWWEAPTKSPILEWKQAMYEAGKSIAAMMDASVESSAVPQTSFKNPEDLFRYGWVPTLDPAHDPVKESDIEPLLENKALDDVVGPMRTFRHNDWHKLLMVHNESYKDAEGKEQPRTGAVYENLVNFTDGVVIIGPKNSSPQWVRENVTKPKKTWNPFSKGTKPDLVPLHHFSDVLYLGLVWAAKELELGPEAVRNIQHIFLFRCADMEMDDKIVKKLPEESIEHRSNNERWSLILYNDYRSDPHHVWPKKWPGSIFPINPDMKCHQAIAALSTPLIKRVAWLLSTHKQELGVRAIDRVVIFDSPLEVPEKEGERGYPGFLKEPIVRDHRNICDVVAQWCAYLHIKDGPIGFTHLAEDPDPDEGRRRSLTGSTHPPESPDEGPSRSLMISE